MSVSKDKAVTLVVTSCGRHDLLKRTLDSFLAHNTYPLTSTIIVEDGDTLPEWKHEYTDVTWILNGRQRGQIYSIDRAYSEVTTPYIFHCEDDWEFTEDGFIEASFAALADPKIWTVNLRADDCNGHPVTGNILKPYWSGGWGGVSFNPGLRRLSDYKKLGSYGRHLGYNNHGFEGELALSKKQLDEGFRIASLPSKYVEHIGQGRSQAGDQTKRPKVPKVLIAIPACHRYSYKDQADGRNHKDQATNERVDAVRTTWQKYLPPFSSYVTMKFFYGRGGERTPLADEVFLDVADDYKSLPQKVKEIYRYALENGYDFVFKGDDDTFIYVDRLLASDFQEHDYLGFATDDPACNIDDRYASGGSGYWLSAKAMTLVVNTAIDDWAEDRWVGKSLLKHRIRVKRDARYLPGFWEHFVDVDALPDNHSYITMHACTPEMMSKLFSKTLVSNFTKIAVAFHEKDVPVQAQAAQAASVIRPQGHSPHAGTPIPDAKPVYIDKASLVLDWWDTHTRPEGK